MGKGISAFVAEYLGSWRRTLGKPVNPKGTVDELLASWQQKLSELVNSPVELSFHHKGINHLVFLVNEEWVVNKEWVLRLPAPTRRLLSADNPSAAEIAARMELFASTHHCPSPRYVFSSAELPPAGGLLIPYVRGRKLRLPADLPLVATCLAALHSTRAGIRRPDIVKTIDERMAFLPQVSIDKVSRAIIDELWEKTRNSLEHMTGLTREDAILADSQPGNFIVDSDNRAVVVDVEGDFVHSAGIDLAHITLFSSLLWRDGRAKPLKIGDIASFYQDYINKRGISSSCEELLALRPLVLCRTLSWMLHLLALAANGSLVASPSLIATASSILSRHNLEILMENEAELL